jgi:hypothetical protein
MRHRLAHRTILPKYLNVYRLGLILAIAVCLSGCFGTFAGGASDALKLETAMHQQMARGDVAGIYNDADQRYRDAVSREKSDALYTSIVRKLGVPLDCKQGGSMMQVGTMGTTIRSECETRFSKDATAKETFVWVKSKDRYRLMGYNIVSNDLITR